VDNIVEEFRISGDNRWQQGASPAVRHTRPTASPARAHPLCVAIEALTCENRSYPTIHRTYDYDEPIKKEKNNSK
jgi:hypothetical protein